jgi:hypothetical protein
VKPKQDLCCAAGVALLSVFMPGCSSGSGNGGGGSTTPPSPGFTLSLSPSGVSLTQGGALQTAQLTVNPENGFNNSVGVNITGLASGVIVSPSALTIAPGTPGTLTFSATAAAPSGEVSGKFQGVSGSLTVNAPFNVTVKTAPAVPFPFVSIGGFPIHGFYDTARQLLFAANPQLNELDVIAQADLSIKTRISLPAAWGVDQMADGKTLVVGTDAQEIYTVDEDTYAVTRYPVPNLGISSLALFYPNPLAMANGKVILIGQVQGQDSEDILNGGQYLIEWDFASNTFSQLTWTGKPIAADSLARSGDRKWAVFGYDPIFLYSTDSDSLTSVGAATVDPNNSSGNHYYALNANGSKIAIVSGLQVIFTDGSFNVLSSVPIPNASGTVLSDRAEFSPDGSRLFFSGLTGVEAVDANGFTYIGFYSLGLSEGLSQEVTHVSFLDVDTNGRIYFGTDNGIRYADTTAAPVSVAAGANLPGSSCVPPNPDYLPLNSATQVSFIPGGGLASGSQVYLGTYPATVPSSGVEYTIDIPASSIAGPVGEECIDLSGFTTVILNAISYGVQVAASSANLLPAIGTPTVGLFGYGILDSTSNSPSVTFGANAAQVLDTNSAPYVDSLQAASVKVPQGTPGTEATISVTSANGSGTLANAVTYLPQTTIVTATGLLGLLYDTHRSVLYALKAGEVDVLDPGTLSWKSPLQLPAAPNLSYAYMALSPDGSKMVLAAADQHLVVLDPGNPAKATVYACAPGYGYESISVSITQSNLAVITGPCNITIDLSTGSMTNQVFGPGFFRASADGSQLYGADVVGSDGTVTSIDGSTLATQSENFGSEFWSDVAVSPDGSHFAAILAPPYADGDIIAFFDAGLHYSYTNVYPPLSPPTNTGVLGASYSPQGKVLAVPLGDSVELWDVAQGTLRARLMTPEQLNVLVFPEKSAASQIAFDPTGQYLYADSASGLTAFKFPTPVDQIASASWPSAMVPDSIHPTVNGTPAARMAAMRARAVILKPASH